MARCPAEAAPQQPTPDSLALIEASAAQLRAEPEVEGWFDEYAHEHAARLALDLDLVDRFAGARDTIVEIGAAPLILTLALARSGRDVIGVDLAPARFAHTISENGLRIEQCDIETEPLPLDDQSADLVLFNEIFEHLRINPVFSVKEIHRILKPGGLLLLSTPNLRSLSGLFNLVVRSRGYAVCGDIYNEYEKLERLGHMGHVREYAPGDVRALLERLGFRVTMMIFRGAYDKKIVDLGLRFASQLRPFVTVVATRV